MIIDFYKKNLLRLCLKPIENSKCVKKGRKILKASFGTQKVTEKEEKYLEK